MEKKTKINILYLIDYLCGFGGSENHLFQLATKLDKDKFDCVVCPFMSRPQIIHKFKENGINIKYLPIPKIYGFNAVRQAFKLIELIKANQVDIVQTFHFATDTYGSLISRLMGVSSIVSSRRDMGDLKPKSQVMVSQLFNRLIDRFIVVADAVGRAFSINEGIPEDKFVTIYNGVDLDNWKTVGQEDINQLKTEYHIDKDDFVLGYVAHFRVGKGHDVLLEAVKKLKPKIKNLKVLLIGRGREYLKEYYQKYCEHHSLLDSVIFVGYTEEIRKFYSAFDVYCLVSDNEGCSNSILEAMASEKPIVCTAVGGNPEVVKDGQHGILIPPQDPDALAEAILKLYHDPDLRKSFGRKSRERIESELSVTKMVEANEKLYIQLYENGKAIRKKKANGNK